VQTDFETLLYEEDDGVATVTLNRPEVHNSFDLRMERELRELWTGLRWNKDVRVVILTGAGDQAFCTGIDRQESIAQDYLALAADVAASDGGGDPDPIAAGPVRTPFMYNDPGDFINPKQNDMWKPVVAAVNGMACGGAFYMLGESDIIIAAEHATFFDPHVTYGMVAGFESVHLLQKLPLGETLRMALLGAHERMTAERAYQLGLVSEVVPKDRLMERARWIARTVASAPAYAVQGTVRAVWMAHELSRREAMAHVSSFVALGTRFEDIAEGQAAYDADRVDPRLR
jgi:enoyl-CoA hydratase/carnithine racemase